MKKIVTTAALCLGLALSGLASAAGKEDAAKAIEAAKAAQKQAASVKGEWRDTGKIIKEAEKAAEEGKFDDAVKLAKKAEDQGMLGHKQALAQANAGHPAYLK